MPLRTTTWTMRCVTVLLTLLLAAGGAVAAEKSGSNTIDEDAFVDITIPFEDGSPMKITYDVTVTDGPRIDVFVMDNANFQKYESNDDFHYVERASDLDVSSTSKSFTLERNDQWHLVLDNTDKGGAQPPQNLQNDPATVQWTVEGQPDVQGTLEQIPGPGVLLSVAVLAGMGLALARRRGA